MRIRNSVLTAVCAVLLCLGAAGISSAAASQAAALPEAYGPVLGFYHTLLFSEKNDDWPEVSNDLCAKFMSDMGIKGEEGNNSSYAFESSSMEKAMYGEASSAGYGLRDLNGDGVPELFILTDSGDGYTIDAIFTLSGKKPVLVGAYWSRSGCTLGGNNTLYMAGSSGATENSEASYTLAADGTLRMVLEIGMEGEDNYYQIKDGKKTKITKTAYDAAQKTFPTFGSPTKTGEITFIPLAGK